MATTSKYVSGFFHVRRITNVSNGNKFRLYYDIFSMFDEDRNKNDMRLY